MGLRFNGGISFRVVLVLTAVLCCIAFQNCSEFHATTSLKENSLTSQCLEKLREEPLPPFDVQSICEVPHNYRCDRRIFHPDVENGSRNETSCAEIEGMDKVCVPVSVMTYDTSVAREPSGENASEFLEGGEYNREEVSCSNMQIRSGDLTLINASSDSLADALKKAVHACRNRSRL